MPNEKTILPQMITIKAWFFYPLPTGEQGSGYILVRILRTYQYCFLIFGYRHLLIHVFRNLIITSPSNTDSRNIKLFFSTHNIYQSSPLIPWGYIKQIELHTHCCNCLLHICWLHLEHLIYSWPSRLYKVRQLKFTRFYIWTSHSNTTIRYEMRFGKISQIKW